MRKVQEGVEEWKEREVGRTVLLLRLRLRLWLRLLLHGPTAVLVCLLPIAYCLLPSIA